MGKQCRALCKWMETNKMPLKPELTGKTSKHYESLEKDG